MTLAEVQRRQIIVNGLRYVHSPYDSSKPSHWKGFGGRKWTVRFMDGECLQSDDLMWDYSFKNRSKPDTAVILAGWTDPKKLPICGWQQAGEYQVFGPLVPSRP